MKKRIQIAMGSKKRKRNASANKKRSQKGSASRAGVEKVQPAGTMQEPRDTLVPDSIIAESPAGASIAFMDTVVRIYYLNLTDSALNRYHRVINSFVSRVGIHHIAEVSLTDVYSEEGFTEASIKAVIEKYLTDTGLSKHKLFWRRNERLKTEDQHQRTKKLLYLEIRFH